MRYIDWTFIIITVVFAVTLCFLVRGCNDNVADERNKKFAQEQMMIDAGYVKESVPASYTEVWIKKTEVRK